MRIVIVLYTLRRMFLDFITTKLFYLNMKNAVMLIL